MTLFANQVAVNLENAQLYQAAVDAAERRTVLHWLSQEIIGASCYSRRGHNVILRIAAVWERPRRLDEYSFFNRDTDESPEPRRRQKALHARLVGRVTHLSQQLAG